MFFFVSNINKMLKKGCGSFHFFGVLGNICTAAVLHRSQYYLITKSVPSYLIYQAMLEAVHNWPWHEISNNVVCATSKASYQPAHARSLIRAFDNRLNKLMVLIYCLNIIWSF